MKILYVGGSGQNGLAKVNAFKRLGARVQFLDSQSLSLGSQTAWNYLIEHRAFRYLQDRITKLNLKFRLRKKRPFDLIFLNQPKQVGPISIAYLREKFGPVILYINDDPFSQSHQHRWDGLLASVPLVDLVVVVREDNIKEAMSLGARHVLRVFMAADIELHKPRQFSHAKQLIWDSRVTFVGTYFPERGPFLVRLIERGVPLVIYGDNWQKAPEWQILRNFHRRGKLVGDDYVNAIQYSDICLGLLSKKNRDLHTTRSFEIPSIGSVLCAEDTPEHRLLYEEGIEAIFFNDPDDCADKCLELLNDAQLISDISRRGRERFLISGNTNDKVLMEILVGFDVRVKKIIPHK